ncbi:MAG: ferrochelatase [Cyclobacteriaceae bacterium]|nr:ferrochelatase [Cyclobacteriaceae bacterium]
MTKTKTGVLLINLGTPDSPSVPDVRKYLREFLMDKRVIDIPFISRWMLVNLIIAPFRAPKSAKTYRQLWEDRGSPLMFHGLDLKQKLSEKLGSDFSVAFGMRYQSPSIASALDELMALNVQKIIVLPLFPQYASATTGSVAEQVMDDVKGRLVIPEIDFISQYPDDELMTDTFAKLGLAYLKTRQYDKVVFSFHGLPERQIRKAAVDGYCQLNAKCCSNYNSKNQFCYRAQCFLTARTIAEKLDLTPDQYTVFFQSRLGKEPWIRPYAEDEIKRLAKEGVKKILIYSAAFTADCLETTIEVGHEFKELFLENGGEEWQLVESLNSDERWVQSLERMVRQRARA